MKEIPTQLRKMAKCMICIGTYAWGKCYGNSFTPFTPSPRRPRPLGGSVINGTIQQLLDTPRAEPVTANLAGTPHSADVVSSTRMWQGTHSARTAPHSGPTWFHCPTSARMWQGTHSAHTAPHSRATWLHPRGCGKATTAACQGRGGAFFPTRKS